MKENLRQQWNEACLQAGLESISVQKAAMIMAVLMLLGNNEAMVMNRHFTADVDYIQKRFNIGGGLIPDPTFVEYFKEYTQDLNDALHQEFIPQWATKLFTEDYEIKLYNQPYEKEKHP